MILCSIFFEAIKCLYKYFYWIVLCVFPIFLCDFPYTIIKWGGIAVNVIFICWTLNSSYYKVQSGKRQKRNKNKLQEDNRSHKSSNIYCRFLSSKSNGESEIAFAVCACAYVLCNVYNRSFRFAIKNELQSKFVWIYTWCIWKNIYENEIQLNLVNFKWIVDVSQDTIIIIHRKIHDVYYTYLNLFSSFFPA